MNNQMDLLYQIRELQTKTGSEQFNKGIFPSYRKNTILGIQRPDDNIFFSVSVLYILKTIYPHLAEKEKEIVDKIEGDLLPNLSLYTNKSDRNSFNFWQKLPHKHFPNGRILSRLNKFQLPDDVDTTSMVHMVSGLPYKEVERTKQALVHHVNGYRYKIQNGHQQLRNYKAYSTWFGEYMPIEFDICVLSNYLLWVNHFQFKLNEYDEETIALLIETIQQSLYLKSSFKSAPEYPKVAVILYHLSRLASSTSFIHRVKNILIKDCWNQFNVSQNLFEKMILQTSLLKLGEDVSFDYPYQYDEEYWWFTAGLLSVYSNSIIEQLATQPLFHFRFTCPAFNLALRLENKVIKGLF
ncbi:hypothetical protein [Labilibacter marinus]|uniref:hypothetical protein n=1 Tax=Labilibacter marinus TaxID=1477105 RepID=UPI000833FB62|nr:hypothetical protein [Labilibacter marinus]